MLERPSREHSRVKCASHYCCQMLLKMRHGSAKYCSYECSSAGNKYARRMRRLATQGKVIDDGPRIREVLSGGEVCIAKMPSVVVEVASEGAVVLPTPMPGDGSLFPTQGNSGC